jgi:hypothetical protein
MDYKKNIMNTDRENGRGNNMIGQDWQDGQAPLISSAISKD